MMEFFVEGCRRRLDGLCRRLCPDPGRLELQSIPLLPVHRTTSARPGNGQSCRRPCRPCRPPARAAHLAAHTSAGGSVIRVVAVQPVPVVGGQPAGAVFIEDNNKNSVFKLTSFLKIVLAKKGRLT